MLTFRKAKPEDRDIYLDWVNDSAVRKNSFNSRPITPAEHESWFSKKITDPDSLLLIFYFDNVPCGQLRFELYKSINTFEIGYSIDKDFRGRGLAKPILEESTKYFREIYGDAYVTAKVKEENIPSVKAFIAAGYAHIADITEKGERYFIYTTQ